MIKKEKKGALKMKDDFSYKPYPWILEEISSAEAEIEAEIEHALRKGIEVNIKCYTSPQHVERKVKRAIQKYLNN